jgi:hypothetical protein
MLGLGNSITGGAALEEAFSLDQISGLQLWLKNGGSQTLNSGNISQWNDDSGNNNHATQSSASFQPQADGGGALFDGSDDRFDLTSDIVLNAFHVFIVLETDTTSNETFLGGASGEFLRIRTSTQFRMKANNALADKNFDSGDTWSANNKALVEVIRTDADALDMFVDGVNFTATTSVSGTGNDASANALTLSQVGTQLNNSATTDGHIYECVIFNVPITGGDLTNVRNDINTRNGL